jgi:hypothetical protein
VFKGKTSYICLDFIMEVRTLFFGHPLLCLQILFSVKNVGNQYSVTDIVIGPQV